MNAVPVPDDRELAEGMRYLVNKVMNYRESKVLMVAADLGLFTALSRGAMPATTVAARLKCDLRCLTILMDALVGLGVLDKTDDLYRNSRMAQRFLVEGSPDYKGNNLRYQERIWRFWSDLGQVVRTGRPAATLGDLLGSESEEFRASYIQGMHDIAQEPARHVAFLLGDQRLDRMLDVGGGPGTFSMAMLERHEGLEADILDLPGTLEVTRRIVAGFQHGERLRLVPGSYLEGDFPSGYDLVLLSHVTHDESPDETQRLVGRAWRALKPGGRIAIHDFVVNSCGTKPVFSALFSVNMLVYTTGGQTYSEAQYLEMLARAGFERPETYGVLEGLAENPSRLIVATRPAMVR